jgi:hypothetical protein
MGFLRLPRARRASEDTGQTKDYCSPGGKQHSAENVDEGLTYLMPHAYPLEVVVWCFLETGWAIERLSQYREK